ncbi:MAG: MBL fold metallo-hydrolase [Marmoricola sp.]
MSDFTEVGDRCWTARQDWFDVNVSVVAGAAGLLVVDTFASAAGARRVLEEVRRLADRLGGLPLLAAANTHVHFDHTFGNDTFAAAGADLLCHEDAAAALPQHADEIRRQAADEIDDDPRHAELVSTDPVVPGRTFSSALVLDLGDRPVELVHPGRGHTGGDAVVRVPDADVVFAGDLVEEGARSGAPGAVPGLGDDCFPLEWPGTLDTLVGMLTGRTVVVPGHGSPVDRDFVALQRLELGQVAQTIADLAGRGVPEEQALRATDWPYPREQLASAVRRGYAQLPSGGRRLPMA